MGVRRTVATALGLALLATAAACGSDPVEPDPEPTPTVEPFDVGDLRPGDLRGALLEVTDIPTTHGTEFGEYRLSQTERPTGDDVVRGPRACIDFLDGVIDPEPRISADNAFADPRSTVTVSSVIDVYEPGEAADRLDEVRDLMGDCDEFTMSLRGELVQVVTHLGEIGDLDGYDGLGDEGILVGLLVVVDGVPVRGTAYTMLRVDDLVAVIGVEVPADFGRDPSPELTAVMDERLRDLMEETT